MTHTHTTTRTTEADTATLLVLAHAAMLRTMATAVTDPRRLTAATRELEAATGALSMHAAAIFGDPIDAAAVADELGALVPELAEIARYTAGVLDAEGAQR